jgi:hypothetical protein
MSSYKYSLSFTTGAALLSETLIVAKLYLELDNWEKVKEKVLTENSLQARTSSTLRKLYGEVSRRLKHMSDEEIQYMVNADHREQELLIWLAICRHYLFIRDFAVEVMSNHYASSRFVLTHDDYNAFFNAKAEWHENLDRASKLTKSKARQVLFKMLRECGLLNGNDEIVGQNISLEMLTLLKHDNADCLRIFPGAGS